MPEYTPTSFIGRLREIDEIGGLLDDPACRLLTLVGPGGIGKTRLALEVASRKRASFPGGVFFVQLASLSRPDQLLAAIAAATPFRFQQDARELRAQFFDYLREKQAQRLLLVIDNYEHLLEGATIAADILQATSNLKILATSREALRLQEEWVRPISGLAYPERDHDDLLEGYSAVQLFLDRARRVQGDFDLAKERASVLEICRLVEGMPLAIELAAGWMRILQPADITRELRRGLDILSTDLRNVPERHHSVRAVFDHSWRLLSDDERDIVRKLSVFRGRFTREAAEIVAGAPLQTLAGLVDKSLVHLNVAGSYTIHELLRQYGAEQLGVLGQTEMLERAYVDYYLGMLRRLECDIKGQQQIQALDTIEADFENIRCAWQLAVRRCHDIALGQAVESLHFFADMRGRYHDVVPLLRAAVEQLPPTPDRQAAYIRRRIQARLARLILLGNLRIDADLRVWIDDCLAAARARQDQAEIGFCLLVSGMLAIWEAPAKPSYADPKALALFRQSCAIYEALGDTFYRAEALGWVAVATPDAEDQSLSLSILKQSRDLRRAIGDRNGVAWLTINLTEAMLLQLDYVECERYAREALALMREIGSSKGILQALFKLAAIDILKGDLEEARALAETLRDLADETYNLDGRMRAAGLLAALRCLVGEDYAQAAALAQKQFALSQESFLDSLSNLGARWGQAMADCGLGNYEAARKGYAALFWGRRDDPGAATICLALEAAACTHERGLEQAAELLGLAFGQPAWASGWLYRWPLLARLRSNLVSQLGEDAYQAAWERGCRYDLQTAITSILGESGETLRSAANSSLIEPLSERELEVLGLIAEGLSNRDIAERLVLAVGTVKVHTRNIYGKLSVNSRTQAIAQATRLNLL